jgi:hypothetical protein
VRCDASGEFVGCDEGLADATLVPLSRPVAVLGLDGLGWLRTAEVNEVLYRRADDLPPLEI